MGTPERDDDAVRVGRDDDDDDDIEEEEEYKEDPEEEEVAGGGETGESEEDRVDGDEELQEAEEEEEEEEAFEEVEDEEEKVVEEDEVELEKSEEDVEYKDKVEGEEVEEQDEVEFENNEEDVENEVEEDEEEDEVELVNNEEDVEKEDEVEEEEEEDEVELKNSEEDVQNENEVEEDDKSSIPSMISLEKDATEILAGEQPHGFKGDSGDINPLIFTKAETLKNENVGCGNEAEGVNEMESDCGKKETSQHFKEKDAKYVDFHAMRGESRGSEAIESLNTCTSILVESGVNKYYQVDHGSEGDGVKEVKFDVERVIYHLISYKDVEDIDMCDRHCEPKGNEAAEFPNTNPPISVEAAPLRNERVDGPSECMGVKGMDSECEEKERLFIKKVAEHIDVYAPSGELKGIAEIAKPLSSIGLDAELAFMQEGGVEDMDLDSEENIVHGSDVDGTVVDSNQENIALSSNPKASFSAGAYVLDNKTFVAGNVMASSSGGKDTMHNHDLELGEGKSTILDMNEHTTLKPSRLSMSSLLFDSVTFRLQGKQRSLPPVTQVPDRNKRPAMICNYYAKGWCIEGNSCRFLHVKENKDSINKQQDRYHASANGQKQVREAKPYFGVGIVASSSAFATNFTSPNLNATLLNDRLQSIANRYINQHSHPTAPSDVYSSRHISPINGSSNSVLSLNPNSYDAHKILSGSRDNNASTSSVGLRPQRDRYDSLGLEPKAETYRWEPSKPFRPSYNFSSPSRSSPGSMYDPLRDSIEHTSLDIGSFRAEPINYPSSPSYPDSTANNFGMDGYNGTVQDRNCHSRVTGLPVTEAEAAESSVADQDKGSGTSHAKDPSESNKTNTVSAEKRSKLLEEKIYSNGVNIDRGLATDDQRESKTFRQFRVALIEVTKELLKPAWRVGKILIVKKTARKVLSSIHSHQVPGIPDLVEQYLSASQPKITKLLEAYVQKHNKT